MVDTPQGPTTIPGRDGGSRHGHAERLGIETSVTTTRQVFLILLLGAVIVFLLEAFQGKG